MQDDTAIWNEKGATLSDKSACAEFGLSRAEILAAIESGKLHYRLGSMYGNPYLRLIRREVEALVRKREGAAGLRRKKHAAELADVERMLRSLRKQTAALEKRKAELSRKLGPSSKK